MKKISLIATLALLPMSGAFAGPGMQNNNNMNKNNQNQPAYWSVMEVVEMPNNTPVKMGNKYLLILTYHLSLFSTFFLCKVSNTS